jgi:hypothetical protein
VNKRWARFPDCLDDVTTRNISQRRSGPQTMREGGGMANGTIIERWGS